jgi:general secretion pathway protein E
MGKRTDANPNDPHAEPGRSAPAPRRSAGPRTPAESPAEQRRRLEGVAELFQPLPIRAEQLGAMNAMPGADEQPWDAILSTAGVEEHAALKALAERAGLDFVEDPKPSESAEKFYEVVPAALAREHQIAGLAFDGDTMTVATSQPLQPSIFTTVERLVDAPVRVVLSPRAQVGNLINRGYEQRQDLVTEIVEDMPFDERAIESAAGSVSKATDLLQLARQTPVIRLVNMILFEALRLRASDIHVQPLEDKLVIRFRVDGMLMDAFSPPLSLAPAISSRLKVMAELDIANRHSPQDGQTTVRIGSRKIDIRLSCVPTIYGERLVLRLLDQSSQQLSLDAVGMTRPMQDELMKFINRPNGMVLVTGPTGSGKTTTLYAALERIDRASRNVMTIEDPVEYHMEKIGQVQVNPKRGVTFASGLRSLLRQDPDVILVGEIRDQETAQLAVQAALTGHLVLATLHTNDAPSAISRLQDIGIEPYLISSALLGVMGQRLLRRVDQENPTTPDGHPNYAGRIAIFEMMKMTDAIRKLAMTSADASEIMAKAVQEGMKPMIIDGQEKVAAGLTTEEELRRVLSED